MKTITILTPAYNEEDVLPLFYDELCRVLDPLDNYKFEFLFINDGSSDNTLRILRNMREKDSRVNYLDMSRNYGKEIGMLAGFDHASGDALVIIDSDLQEPPAVIPEMIHLWEKGFKDVYGRRRQRNQKISKRLPSTIFHKILASLSDVDLKDDSGDFRLLDRQCVDALRSMRENQRYTKGMYSWIGFDKAYVDYDINPRAAGTTKWSVSRLMGLALDGITSHSVVPLRMASYAGMTVSVIAFIYLIYVVIKALFNGDDVAGYPSLMAVILFLGGFILMALGIIGEYLGRIFIETKQRPPYFIKSFNGKKIE